MRTYKKSACLDELQAATAEITEKAYGAIEECAKTVRSIYFVSSAFSKETASMIEAAYDALLDAKEAIEKEVLRDA